MFGLKYLLATSRTTTRRNVPYSYGLLVDFLLVGAGGAIGAANGGLYYCGGGGAGGMICSGQLYQGGGGAASPPMLLAIGVSLSCGPAAETVSPASYNGAQGSASTITGAYNYTANGGGLGGAFDGYGSAAGAGGSGGGGGSQSMWPGGAGTANQGYAGGNGVAVPDGSGGGGGGAGGVGGVGSGKDVGGTAGLGLLWIDGKVYGYGGRGAHGYQSGTLTNGSYAANRPSNGAPNRGAGSGSSVQDDASGGACNGGAGVVVFAYKTGAMTFTGGTITNIGAKTFHTFTVAGSFTRTS